MKVKLHWESSSGDEDSLCIEGDSIEEIRNKAEEVRTSRGLDVEKNNMWSEKIDCA